MSERRSYEPRRGADARAERNYDAVRRRLDGLEKALTLIVGSMVPGTHLVDNTKATDYRLGIDIGRSLLSVRQGSAPAGGSRKRLAKTSISCLSSSKASSV